MEPSNALDFLWPETPRMVRPPAVPSGKTIPRGPQVRGPAHARPPADGITHEASTGDLASLPDLVARMARRDEAALAAFYDATIARVYGLALRIVRSAAEAEEIAVDTIHQAWRHATTPRVAPRWRGC